jgi:hypothetical protein
VREQFLADMIWEVLGPKGGPREVLESDPRGLYLTGILAPEVIEKDKRERSIEAEAELPTEALETPTSEEDVDDQDVIAPPVFSPALDPRALPRTLGLTFAVEDLGIQQISACLSWARYQKKGNSWAREPRIQITQVKGLRLGHADIKFFNLSGECAKDQAEVSLRTIVRKTPSSNRLMVTLQMSNELRTTLRSETEAYLFQPQIRVESPAPLAPVFLDKSRQSDEDEQKLEFLQRERPVLARGHLCSAVWKELDPEGLTPRGITSPNVPPFVWIDGQLLNETERRRFSPPDVRTEFIPIYPVETPAYAWASEGLKPELHSDVLAECWDRGHLSEAFSPLLDAYDQWVKGQEPEAKRWEQAGYVAAQRLHNERSEARRRMRQGLDILLADEDARLAFCFACKAVDLQHRWQAQARGRQPTAYEWRPFQLAFVLMTLESVIRPDSYDRDVCDLIWVPTGLGKTEAYLALAAFVMAYRRRRALRRREAGGGGGTAVLSRYTLRLLTIQQFRRALAIVTACEYLRVFASRSKPVGWRPEDCTRKDDFLWGSARFSIGLWVGGQVTPNYLETKWIERPDGKKRPLYGAVDILKGVPEREQAGEPAQALDCPACGALLAVPEPHMPPGTHKFYWIVRTADPSLVEKALRAATGHIAVTNCMITPNAIPGYHTIEVELQVPSPLSPQELDKWWETFVAPTAQLVSARASRPGYFIRSHVLAKGASYDRDFELFCPKPSCPLNDGVAWLEGVPVDDGLLNLGLARGPKDAFRGLEISRLQTYEAKLGDRKVTLPDGLALRAVPDFILSARPGSTSQDLLFVGNRIPIPAYTVDEQIYHQCPSMVIATVDKFARLAWEPRAGGIFGYVTRYHPRLGFFREGAQSDPGGAGVGRPLHVSVQPFPPPELILQDELHLVEGPLGSLAGLYETAIAALCRRTSDSGPKYIASTATIRQAREQIRSLFSKRLYTFPPHGMHWGDRFFLREREPHSADESHPGRLYVGICSPGRGPLTPIVRILARLLQSSFEQRQVLGDAAVDPYWSPVAYFNALRELAGARALYRQDIPEWIQHHLATTGPARPLPDDAVEELSSRRDSMELPQILQRLSSSLPNAPDALFATSMFGTGVDVQRLSLMLVNGQPKTTSSYIQATGRVGRTRAGLVVTFLRASRPRDLSHYEFFCGYHRRLFTFVEPVTVMPFSPGAMERAAGPVAVAILRNKMGIGFPWQDNASAGAMQQRRRDESWLSDVFEVRAGDQPSPRRPDGGVARHFVASELDRWSRLAAAWADLHFVEYAIDRPPQIHVVLGDAAHKGKDVFPMAPQSLRDIEDSVKVQI